MTAQSQHNPLRDIPIWAARYAQYRRLVVVPMLLLYLVVYAILAGTAWLAVMAYLRHSPAALLLDGLTVALCVLWVWLSLSGRLAPVERYFGRIYPADSEVVAPAPSLANCRGMRTAGLLFGTCIVLTVAWGFVSDLPIRYMQPISALYSVPFLFYLWYAQGRATPLMLLWPILYGLHAVLFVAGVPMGVLANPTWSVLAPMAGYGLIAGVASYLYSRYALRRLRALAQSPEADATRGGADDGAAA